MLPELVAQRTEFSELLLGRLSFPERPRLESEKSSDDPIHHGLLAHFALSNNVAQFRRLKLFWIIASIAQENANVDICPTSRLSFP